MAAELPYFKFFPGEYMKGDITICSMEAQGLFVNVCSYYWMKLGDLKLTSVQHRFNTCSTALEELLNNEIFVVKDGKICIGFMDDQLDEFEKMRNKKSRAGRISAKKRKGNTCSTGVQHNPNKEEKIREDKDKRRSVESFIDFFKENGYTKDSAIRAFDYYSNRNWIDSKGNPVLNWKNKVRQVWFKPENKDELIGTNGKPKLSA
jgi:hypothetical protein